MSIVAAHPLCGPALTGCRLRNTRSQAVLAIGVGLLFSAIKFVTVAPLPPSLNAQAMSFFTFSRSFGNVLGVTIGSAVLATELRERLPEEYLSTLPSVSAAFSRITYVKEL